jgi:hypothetical protein
MKAQSSMADWKAGRCRAVALAKADRGQSRSVAVILVKSLGNPGEILDAPAFAPPGGTALDYRKAEKV